MIQCIQIILNQNYTPGVSIVLFKFLSIFDFKILSKLAYLMCTSYNTWKCDNVYFKTDWI